MSEKFISLEAEPIVKTTVEEIEEYINMPYVSPMNDQAQERIQRLSEQVRFLVDELRKSEASNRSLTRDRGELTAQILRLNRECMEYSKDLLKWQLQEGSKAAVAEALEIQEKESCFGYISRYLSISQQYSIFRSGYKEARSTEHFNDAVQGLAEEVWEMEESLENSNSTGTSFEALKKELGDVCWNLAELCDAMGFSMEAMAEEVNRLSHERRDVLQCIQLMKTSSMKLLSHGKKVHGRGHDLNEPMVWDNALNILMCAFELSNTVGWKLEDVLQLNLEKNHKRYPSGVFTSQDSIQRVDVQ